MISKYRSILAIIPARGGSKGIPQKNIKTLNGIPLIGYTLLEAQKSKYITRVVVSTDDEEIAEVSRQFDAEVPCLRPKELAEDASSTKDCVFHMISYLKEKENYMPDYICLLQCTSPLRTSIDIDGAAEKLINSDFDSIISVCRAEINPYCIKLFENDKLINIIEEDKTIRRRQDFPEMYIYNGAIYIIKTDIFMKEKAFRTENTTGYIMSAENSVDIDTMLDFKIAEILIKGCENS